MSETKDVSLRVLATLEEFRAEMETMPAIVATEAKKASAAMQAELSKGQKGAGMTAVAASSRQAQTALSGVSTSAATTATKLRLVEDGAGRAESVTRALGGALGMLSPELQGVAAVGAEAAGGLEAVLKVGPKLAGPLAAITAAVGVGALAWKHYSDELKEAEAWVKKQADAADEAAARHRALADAEIQVAVMLGRMTEDEAALARGRQRAQELTGQYIDDNTKKIGELVAASARLAGEGGTHFEANREAIEKNQAAINELTRANQNLEGKTVLLGVALSGVTKKHADAGTGASTQRAEVDKLATSLATIAEQVAAEDNPFASIDQEVADIERLRTAYTLTAEQMAITDERLAQLATNRAGIAAEEAEKLADAERDAAKERERAAAELQAAQDRLDASRKADNAARKAEEERNNAASLAGVTGLMGATEALIALRVESGELTREEAEKAFRYQKAAGLASVAINTAVAVTKALADLGPVAGALAVAGIIASGAAQAAAISSQDAPSFHTGGVVGDPSEQSARLRKGEGVLTGKGVEAVGGAEGVRRLNGAGAAAQPSKTVIEMRVDGRTADRIVYTAARKGTHTREVLAALRPTRRVNPYG